MKKILIIMAVVSALLFVVLIGLDICNIRGIIPLTKEYDWLAFIGTYLSAIGTITLGIISYIQNDKLSKLNRKMMSNNMVSNNYSQIELCGDYFIDEFCDDDLKDCYAFKMKSTKCKKEAKKFHKLIIQFVDNRKLPLENAIVNKLVVQYKTNGEFNEIIQNESTYLPADSYKMVKLEVTPKKDEVSYYLPIAIIDNERELKSILAGGEHVELRFIVDISIINSFGVVSNGEYTFRIRRTGQKGRNVPWEKYELLGRKIYYKNIYYNDSYNLDKD